MSTQAIIPRTNRKTPAQMAGRELANYLILNLQKQLKKLKFEPIEELIGIYNSPDTPVNLRATIAMEILTYTAPKPKSIDLNIQQQGNLTIEIVRFGDGQKKTSFIDTVPAHELMPPEHEDRAKRPEEDDDILPTNG